MTRESFELGPRTEILLVEDQAGDAVAVREALAASGVDHRLHVVEDGESAIAFLCQDALLANAPTPNLVLLDLDLPRKSGIEVLRFLKSELHLRRIPVIVVTGSSDSRDLAACYDAHANCFVSKPSVSRLASIIAETARFWTEVATLPPPSASCPHHG